MKKILLLLLSVLTFGVYAQTGCPSQLPLNHIPGPDTIFNYYDQTFRSLAVNPKNNNHVIVGTEGNGIFISYDGGMHWRWERDGFRHLTPDGYAETWFIEFDPKDTAVVYAATTDSPGPTTGSFGSAAAGVYKSTDHAETWHQQNCGLPSSSATAIWCDPDSTQNLVVSISGAAPSFTNPPKPFYDGGIFYSNDGGLSWIKAITPVNVDSVAAWKFISAGDTLFTCLLNITQSKALGFMKSYDKGRTWIRCADPLAGRLLPDFAVAPDGQHLATVVRDSAVVYTSDNAGNSWTRYNMSVNGAMVWHPLSVDTLFFADQNILYKSRNGIKTADLLSPDYKMVATFTEYIEKVVFAPSDPMTMYVSTRGYQVYKSTDGGEHFSLAVNLRDVMEDSIYHVVPTLLLGDDTLDVNAAADTLSVSIICSTSWIADHTASWVNVMPAAGSGNGTIQVILQANAGPARSASVTVTAGSVIKTIVVNQAAVAPVLLLETDTVWIPSTGDTLSVALSSNTSWTAGSAAGWVKVNPASGSGNDTLDLMIENNGGAARVSAITVMAGMLTRTIVVMQQGFAEQLAVSDDTLIAAAGGDTFAVRLLCNTVWSLNNPMSWITVNHLGGNGNDSLVVAVAANTGTTRSATLTITAGSLIQKIYVEQGALVIPSLTLGEDSIMAPVSGITQTVQVLSNVTWTVNNPANWITVSPGTGTGNDTLEVMVAANTGAARSAVVGISAGSLVRFIHVAQQQFETTLELGEDTIRCDIFGTEVNVTITCNTTWSANTSDSWITISKFSGTGDDELTCIVDSNMTGSSRLGLVSVTAGALTRRVFFVQKSYMTGLQTPHAFSKMRLFPNPTSGKLVVKNESNSNVEVNVFDMNGRLVDSFSNTAYGEKLLDYSGFSNGLYIVTVRSERGVTVERFVITK